MKTLIISIFLALTLAYASAGSDVTIGDKTYWLETDVPQTWAEADAQCVTQGKVLVSLETEAKDIEIGQWLSDNDFGDVYFWSGGTSTGGKFVWNHDSSEFTHTRWYPGEPDDESWDICVMFQGRHGWHDFSCDYPYAYMCQ